MLLFKESVKRSFIKGLCFPGKGEALPVVGDNTRLFRGDILSCFEEGTDLGEEIGGILDCDFGDGDLLSFFFFFCASKKA